MPKKAEEALRREANKHKDWSKERKDRYVYGALRDMGWKPERERGGSGGGSGRDSEEFHKGRRRR